MKAMKKALALGLALAMVVTAVPVTSAQAASTAKLSASTVSVAAGTAKKQTKSVKVTTPSTWKSVKVKASSSDKKIATVKVSGKTVKVTAVKKGSAKVIVKVTAKKGKKAVSKTLKANVKVVNAGLRFTTAPTEVTVGEEVKFVAKKCPQAAKVTFTSSDETIATVAADGTVKGVKAGDVTITATSDYGKKVTAAVKVAPATPVVDTAVAANATTITLSGKHLELLTVNEVKVAGYTVTGVKASEDGKTADATLGSALVPDQEVTATVTINGAVKEFKVKYSVAASTVSVKNATYGTNGDAALTVQVNEKDSTVDELIANGYDVTFYAYQEVNGVLNADTTLLGAASNKNGKLADPRTVGTYQVKVVLTKGGVSTTSAYATIKVTDKKYYENAIKRAKLVVTTGGKDYTYNAETEVSAKSGDKLVLKDLVTSNSYGSDDSIGNAQLAKVIMKSDNTAVATIDNAAATIKTFKPGTAKITLTYGTLTKDITLTVKTDARSFKTVKVDGATTVIPGADVVTKIYAVDNYGAYMQGQYVYAKTTNNVAVDAGAFEVVDTKPATTNLTASTTTAAAIATSADGCVYLHFKAANNSGQQATFSIFEGAASNGYKGSLLANYNVTTASTENSNYKLEIVKGEGKSADATIDYNPAVGDGKIELALNKYYGNVKESTVGDLKTGVVSGWTISYDSSIVTVTPATGAATVISSGLALKDTTPTAISGMAITPTGKAGSTTVTLKDNTQVVKASFTVTTVNTVPSVKDIALTRKTINNDVASTIDYKNIFNVVNNEANPELKGVTLANNANGYNKIKLCTAPSASLKGWELDKAGWSANTNQLQAGDIYIETAAGNLCIGKIAVIDTKAAGTPVLVTSPVAISVNQDTTLNFAVYACDATLGTDAPMYYLDSSISVNSYK